MSAVIHPTAIVARGVDIANDVEIGAYTVIEEGCSIGPFARIASHVVIGAGTRIGARTEVFPFAVVGVAPQAYRYLGEPTRTEIGDDNVIREHVTIHRGTVHGGGVTRIGRGSLIMVGCHIAHDCQLGDGLQLANGTLLGGHVTLEASVVTGGAVAIAPFVRVGTRAFLAGGAMAERDVPPYVIASGDRARVRALNRVGLDRGGVPEASRKALSMAFRAIFRGGEPRALAAKKLVDHADPYVRELAQFVAARAPK